MADVLPFQTPLHRRIDYMVDVNAALLERGQMPAKGPALTTDELRQIERAYADGLTPTQFAERIIAERIIAERAATQAGAA